MEDETKQAFAEYLIAMGDDELILGHRNSEWCGHAPILEEDIAFANIALDEIGHARVWYQIAAELLGKDPEKYPDQLVFFRDPQDFRCIQMLALPNGDWAFTVLRQYLFDSFEVLRLESLMQSSYSPAAEAAAKLRNEEVYHLRHGKAWLPRLGLGTEESHRRMQDALDMLWPYALQLGQMMPGEENLMDEKEAPITVELFTVWKDEVIQVLQEANLVAPDDGEALNKDRTEHEEHLTVLLEEMQEVPRQHPQDVRW